MKLAEEYNEYILKELGVEEIMNPEDEDLSEDSFKLSTNECGMPYDGGLGIL